MAAPSAFSYAQAAKGRAAASSDPSSNTASQSINSQQPADSAENIIEATDSTRNSDIRSTAGEKHDVDSASVAESDVRSEQIQDKRIESRRDDEGSRLDRPWRRTDKGTRSSSATTRSVDDQETRRPKKGKKVRGSDKQSGDQAAAGDDETPAEPEVPKVELSEAPIPSVNIWQQRKEQLAKVIPAVQAADDKSSSSLARVDGSKDTLTVADAAVLSPKDGASAVNGTKPQRKLVDSTRPERNGSRGSRVMEKDGKDGKSELPPSVNDAIAWPTPETVLKEDKKKTSDKVEKPEKDSQDDASQLKPRQKEKWVAYDYVPTVNFETQLPQLRNSKPRGGARGANGTRSTANAQAGDKNTAVTTGQKTNDTRDRPREGASGSHRTTSLPPTSKRTSADTSSSKEQRKASGHSATDKIKEASPSTLTEQGNAGRQDSRSDRGRGGYRGRGGHHTANSHSQHHLGPNFATTGPMPSRNAGPYSPTMRQSGQGQQAFMPPPQRGGRGRNAGGSNYHHRMSLPNGGVSRFPAAQAQYSPYEYPMSPMSAMTYQPQPDWDNVVLSLLKNQIEYYFSIENLCKDVFLRKHMDSQGFVHLHFIAAFKRIQEMSVDMAMLRAVCEASAEIDFVVGEDGGERVRRRLGWEKFILPMEDRENLAQNDGPMHITSKSRPYSIPAFSGMASAPFGISSPPAFIPPTEPVPQQAAEHAASHAANGLTNGGTHGPYSQLSANVPDFSPSGSFVPGSGKPTKNAQQTQGASLSAEGDMPNVSALTNGVHKE